MMKKLAACLLALLLSVSVLPVSAENTAGETSGVSSVSQKAVPSDVSWSFNPAETTALPGTMQPGGTTSGEYEGILIDASAEGSKFSPRATDTQINAGTVFTIPVTASEEGAVLTLRLSGGSSVVEAGSVQYSSANGAVTIPVGPEDTECVLTFVSQTYLAGIELVYNQPEEEYPGVPSAVEAEDITYTFTTTDGLKDEAGQTPASGKLEGNRGYYEAIKVDAVSGKFNVQPDASRVVINAGTVLYLPVAYDAKGAVLLISGTQDGNTPSQITVDGVSQTTNQPIAVDMSDSSAYPRYLKVEFTTIAYVNSISLNYASCSDFGKPEVEARDKIWDFTASSTVERPAVQGAKAEFDGMQIDASVGKFSPRETDTQVNAGTVLYIPVAPDAQGATVTVAGNNYNNLTLTLNEETVIQTGEEVILPSVSEPTYIPLSFESADGTGSCYLTSISIDYASDNEVIPTVVTVGKTGCTYSSIQSALDANTSSANRPLVLLIAPGTYTEKVTVNKPWVSFQAMPSTTGEAVVIEESYYSSNTFDADGTFIPQDEYDVGTDQSGTVLLTANATGFSACGITFQNSYNIVDHTQKGEQTPAVALGSVADKVYFKDCRFLGRQDTLYLHGAGARVFVENCYIEGTVDFVFGDANAYFLNCDLYMAYFTGKDNGYFTAANTKKDDVGFVFYDCSLKADPQYAAEGGEVSLGRPWQTEIYTVTGRKPDGSSYLIEYDPSRVNPTYENTGSAVTFVGCTMDSSIKSDRWNVWTRKDADGNTVDVTYHPNVRFAEYNSRNFAGEALTPSGEITLGIMEQVEDAAAMTDALLKVMGFGTGAGYWMPSFTDYTGETPVTTTPVDLTPEIQPVEPVDPSEPSEPSEPSNPSKPSEPSDSSTGGSGSSSGSSSSDSSDPVGTGDIFGFVSMGVAVCLLSGGWLALRSRKKEENP